jgi:hypothetical protein
MKDNVIIYVSKNGRVKVDVSINNDDAWMSQDLMAKLYDTTKNNISMHLKNIFDDGELIKEATVKKILTVQKEGNRNVKRNIEYYNLDAIIAVGYRINSKKATEFRIWATRVLKEYMIKGFALDDERLKNNGESPYFEELLARIRDIRSSEKIFWRKVLDIYATSIDYDPKNSVSIEFFKTVQNKMHYATHGNTVAEVIFNRVDSEKENIGLTNFKGSVPTKAETEVAKNYLTLEELDFLNKLVTAYLDVAEVNALRMHAMTMSDWVKELDSFLTMTHNDILNHKGKISHEKALEKAHEEYDKYMKTHLTQAEKDYLEIMGEDIKKLK